MVHMVRHLNQFYHSDIITDCHSTEDSKKNQMIPYVIKQYPSVHCSLVAVIDLTYSYFSFLFHNQLISPLAKLAIYPSHYQQDTSFFITS